MNETQAPDAFDALGAFDGMREPDVWNPYETKTGIDGWVSVLDYSVSTRIRWHTGGSWLRGKPCAYNKNDAAIETEPGAWSTSLVHVLCDGNWADDEYVRSGIKSSDLLLDGHALHWPVLARNASVADDMAARGITGVLLVPVTLLREPFADVPKMHYGHPCSGFDAGGHTDNYLHASLLRMFHEYEASGRPVVARIDYAECRWSHARRAYSTDMLPAGIRFDAPSKSYVIEEHDA